MLYSYSPGGATVVNIQFEDMDMYLQWSFPVYRSIAYNTRDGLWQILTQWLLKLYID